MQGKCFGQVIMIHIIHNIYLILSFPVIALSQGKWHVYMSQVNKPGEPGI